MTLDPDVWAAIVTVAGRHARIAASSDRAGGRWLVRGDLETVVVKRARQDQSPARLHCALTTAAQAGVRCPPLLRTVECGDAWYAVYRHLDGLTPEVDSPAWASAWREAFKTLAQLHARTETTAPPEETVERTWMRTLETMPWHGGGARLFEWLQSQLPAGSWTLAHGDFAPQNFVWTDQGLLMIDWDEAGYGAAGFDAGWLLALNRIGAGPRLDREVLLGQLAGTGPPRAHLGWFEALGLLRLNYRARTMAEDQFLRAELEELTSAAVEACVAELFE